MSSAVDDFAFLKNYHHSVNSDKVNSTQWYWQQDTSSGASYDSGKVVFDLSQFSNMGSSSYIDWARANLVIPLVATMNTSGANPGINRSDFALSLKRSFAGSLINQVTLEVNNKIIMNTSNYQNIPAYFSEITSMCVDDKNCRSYSGLDNLDTPSSWAYNKVSPSLQPTNPKTFNGNGLCNNTVLFENDLNTYYGAVGTGLNTGALSNEGIKQRCRNIRSLNTNIDMDDILDETSLRNELKEYTRCASVDNSGDSTNVVAANSYQVWFFNAIIPLSNICGDYFKNLGMIKGSHYVKLTLDTNCVGSFYLNRTVSNVAGTIQSSFAGNSTFNWTCPIQVNPRGINFSANANTNTCSVVVSLGINKPPSALISGLPAGQVQHSTLGLQHALPSCRIYVPVVDLTLDAANALVSRPLSKRVRFDDYSQTGATIAGKTELNMVVSSSVRGAYALLVACYPSRNTHGVVTGVNTTPFSVLQSPFAPLATPFGLQKVNVYVNNKSLFQNDMSYTWEQYLECLKGFRSLNGNEEMGLSSCIPELSKDAWENQRLYIFPFNDVNLEASSSVNLRAYNPSTDAVDVLIWILQKKEVVVNTMTGQFESSNFF